MIEIDGSYLEGGGQIIRTAVGLSAVTGKACRISNIRKGRKVPGLKAQHVKGVGAVSFMCDADIRGMELGSTELTFVPKKLDFHNLTVDVGTAGSLTLVLQTLLIPLVHTDREIGLKLTGGTHVKWSPTIDYFERVLCYFLGKMGIRIEVDIDRPGFFPKGGGVVRVSVRPGKLKPLVLSERGEFARNEIWAFASKELERGRVAERMVGSVNDVLHAGRKNINYSITKSPGCSIQVNSGFRNSILGATCLGERGMPAERVGQEAVRLLKEQTDTGACLDEWMGDQILPYLALAPGKSRVSVSKLTDHARTNIWVIGKFLDREFRTEENGRNVIVSCE